jgi:hypothetical protein
MSNLASRYATQDARTERSVTQHDAVMTLADRYRKTFRQIVSRHVTYIYIYELQTAMSSAYSLFLLLSQVR